MTEAVLLGILFSGKSFAALARTTKARECPYVILLPFRL